jgi:hypothetical protein
MSRSSKKRCSTDRPEAYETGENELPDLPVFRTGEKVTHLFASFSLLPHYISLLLFCISLVPNAF